MDNGKTMGASLQLFPLSSPSIADAKTMSTGSCPSACRATGESFNLRACACFPLLGLSIPVQTVQVVYTTIEHVPGLCSPATLPSTHIKTRVERGREIGIGVHFKTIHRMAAHLKDGNTSNRTIHALKNRSTRRTKSLHRRTETSSQTQVPPALDDAGGSGVSPALWFA